MGVIRDFSDNGGVSIILTLSVLGHGEDKFKARLSYSLSKNTKGYLAILWMSIVSTVVSLVISFK